MDHEKVRLRPVPAGTELLLRLYGHFYPTNLIPPPAPWNMQATRPDVHLLHAVTASSLYSGDSQRSALKPHGQERLGF